MSGGSGGSAAIRSAARCHAVTASSAGGPGRGDRGRKPVDAALRLRPQPVEFGDPRGERRHLLPHAGPRPRCRPGRRCSSRAGSAFAASRAACRLACASRSAAASSVAEARRPRQAAASSASAASSRSPTCAQTASTAEVTSATSLNDRRMAATAAVSVTAWMPVSDRFLRASGTAARAIRTEAPGEQRVELGEVLLGRAVRAGAELGNPVHDGRVGQVRLPQAGQRRRRLTPALPRLPGQRRAVEQPPGEAAIKLEQVRLDGVPLREHCGGRLPGGRFGHHQCPLQSPNPLLPYPPFCR